MSKRHRCRWLLGTPIGIKMNKSDVAYLISESYTQNDYGVMEKTSRAWICPVSFGWSDFGTWESLYNYIPTKDCNGNAFNTDRTLTEGTRETLVISPDKKKLIAIKGLEDYMVIDTEDALVICPKDDKKFKDFISGLGMPGFEKFR